MDSSRNDRPSDDETQGRRLFEGAVPELIKRVIETGIGKIAEGPESLRSFVSDLKLPKEIANYLLLQIEETKNGLHRTVAKEIRGYLEKNDLGDEIARALSQVAIEIKTEIRFVPKTETKDRAGSEERPGEPRR
jgi:hypothetical protein